ncbi:MAG TPA: amidohydrolase family protein [Planctomycetaceae bacterium]|nr:amidohydrolase family protein [Planctomycetaceae bacterium]
MTSERLPIIDTHVHLWDLEQVRLPWLHGEATAPIRRSFRLDDYREAAAGLNVARAVYLEVNVDPADQRREAAFAIDLCRRDDNPIAAAVIGGSPLEASFAGYVEAFAGDPCVKGVRTVLHDPDRPPGMCLAPQFVENMRVLGRLGLHFELCLRPGEVGDGVRLAGRCPGTRFVIDHCGNMPVWGADEALRAQWTTAIRAAAGLENVVCKISGIVVTARSSIWFADDLAPVVDLCFDAFGEDRCFFGGDWPVCTLRSSLGNWVGALEHIVRGRSPAFQRKLFHDNAARFYRLLARDPAV